MEHEYEHELERKMRRGGETEIQKRGEIKIHLCTGVRKCVHEKKKRKHVVRASVEWEMMRGGHAEKPERVFVVERECD